MADRTGGAGEPGSLVLVGDIGGTNARFALADPDGVCGDVAYLPTSGFPRMRDAIQAFLTEHPEGHRVSGAAVCGAGPVVDGPDGPTIRMTNAKWEISARELGDATGIDDPVVMNDFAAQARGVLLLGPDHLQRLGGGPDDAPAGPIAVLGPGTGLGAAALVPDRDGNRVVVATEGGHMDLSATSPREIAVLEQLMARFGGHISAERVLSGAGLANVRTALAEIEGAIEADALDPPAVLEAARAGGDPFSVEAVTLFTGWLGGFAGNLALAYGATGGVYVAGGVTPRLGPLFDEGLFRRRFESKGRMKTILEPIPAWLVLGGEPALAGLAAEASRGFHVHVAGRNGRG